jgi:hypothetical protein
MSNVHEINQPGRAAVPAPGLSAPAPLASNEDPAEFAAALKCFRTELRPRSMVQQVLVYQIATVAWRLRDIGFHQVRALSRLTQRPAAVRELAVLTQTESRLQTSLCQLLAELESSGWTVPKDRPRAAATS